MRHAFRAADRPGRFSPGSAAVPGLCPPSDLPGGAARGLASTVPRPLRLSHLPADAHAALLIQRPTSKSDEQSLTVFRRGQFDSLCVLQARRAIAEANLEDNRVIRCAARAAVKLPWAAARTG